MPGGRAQSYRAGHELPINPRRRQKKSSSRPALARRLSPKLREIYNLQPSQLLSRLRDYGVAPEDIDIVIDTHLHFDHCGGNTRIEQDKVVPTFPRAQYFVQKAEYDHAVHPTERDRASYLMRTMCR